MYSGLRIKLSQAHAVKATLQTCPCTDDNYRAHWRQSADRADTLAGREVARTLDRAANVSFLSYSLSLQRVTQGLTLN